MGCDTKGGHGAACGDRHASLKEIEVVVLITVIVNRHGFEVLV